jgi:hypothetical protein
VIGLPWPGASGCCARGGNSFESPVFGSVKRGGFANPLPFEEGGINRGGPLFVILPAPTTVPIGIRRSGSKDFATWL